MYEQLKRELEEVTQAVVAGGLNMTSLLVFPPGLRQLLTWMMRQKVVQAAQVASFIGQDEATTQALMDEMIKKGLIEEEESADGALYQVPIRSSRNYRVPDKVWKAIDE